ncbi:hypothetical protein HJFPF1_05636 [Paramyrothecium foliicola]|nr:hypothetical protein HJFPF1_05636 [Paramyrothecium foliicola]
MGGEGETSIQRLPAGVAISAAPDMNGAPDVNGAPAANPNSGAGARIAAAPAPQEHPTHKSHR